MNSKQDIKFTKYVTLGFWLSLVFFIVHATAITLLNLCATPILSIIVFLSFAILSFSPNYNQNYKLSPCKIFSKLFGKRKNKTKDNKYDN